MECRAKWQYASDQPLNEIFSFGENVAISQFHNFLQDPYFPEASADIKLHQTDFITYSPFVEGIQMTSSCFLASGRYARIIILA